MALSGTDQPHCVPILALNLRSNWSLSAVACACAAETTFTPGSGSICVAWVSTCSCSDKLWNFAISVGYFNLSHGPICSILWWTLQLVCIDSQPQQTPIAFIFVHQRCSVLICYVDKWQCLTEFWRTPGKTQLWICTDSRKSVEYFPCSKGTFTR